MQLRLIGYLDAQESWGHEIIEYENGKEIK